MPSTLLTWANATILVLSSILLISPSFKWPDSSKYIYSNVAPVFLATYCHVTRLA